MIFPTSQCLIKPTTTEKLGRILVSGRPGRCGGAVCFRGRHGDRGGGAVLQTRSGSRWRGCGGRPGATCRSSASTSSGDANCANRAASSCDPPGLALEKERGRRGEGRRREVWVLRPQGRPDVRREGTRRDQAAAPSGRAGSAGHAGNLVGAKNCPQRESGSSGDEPRARTCAWAHACGDLCTRAGMGAHIGMGAHVMGLAHVC